jgi:acetyl-CoA synthetase
MPFEPEDKKNGYQFMYADFSIPVPEYYNFGFDVIDQWAKKDPARPVLLWVNQKGEEKKFTLPT